MANKLNGYECETLQQSKKYSMSLIVNDFFLSQATCLGSWSMSAELECQVQVSSGALKDSWRAKVGKRGKWNNWVGIWFIHCVLWGRDRVNDCSALQCEGASEPDSFFKKKIYSCGCNQSTLHVTHPASAFWVLSHAHILSLLLSCTHTYNHPPP